MSVLEMANGSQARGQERGGQDRAGQNFQARRPQGPKRAENFFGKTIFVEAKLSKISYIFLKFNFSTKLIKYSL